jgi:hypothetical protein
MTDRDCDPTRELMAELALGVAAGDERARAVQHLEGCAECRREAAGHGDVLDELLLLASDLESPLGFDSRVLDAVGARRRTAWWRRALAHVAVAVLAASATGVGAYLATREDRALAGQLRVALERANGRYLGVEILHASGGDRAGHVFVYRGELSWAFAVVPPDRAGEFAVEVVTRDGEVLDAGTIHPTPEANGAGIVLPVDLADVETIRLLPESGAAPLEAAMPA